MLLTSYQRSAEISLFFLFWKIKAVGRYGWLGHAYFRSSTTNSVYEPDTIVLS